MALLHKTGVVALDTATGTQEITGVGFQGKCGIFRLSIATAEGAFTNVSHSYGIAVSSTERGCITIRDDDSAATMDTAMGSSTSKILRLFSDATLPAVDCEVDFVSWDADGFTIDITDAPPGAYRMHYDVFGGDTISAAEITSFAPTLAPYGPTGVLQTVTMDTEYDALIFLSARTFNSGSPADTNAVGVCFGWAVNGSGQGCVSISSADNTSTSQAKPWMRSDSCLLGMFAGTSITPQMRAHVVNWSSSGFTLRWDISTDAGTVENIVLVMGIKGGLWWAGPESQRVTSTGTKATTGVGFQPSGLMAITASLAANQPIAQRNTVLTLGGTDGTDDACLTAQIADAAPNANTDGRDSSSKFIQMNNNDVAIIAECDVQSFDADGFTLNWTTVGDGTARQFQTLAFATGVEGATFLLTA